MRDVLAIGIQQIAIDDFEHKLFCLLRIIRRLLPNQKRLSLTISSLLRRRITPAGLCLRRLLYSGVTAMICSPSGTNLRRSSHEKFFGTALPIRFLISRSHDSQKLSDISSRLRPWSLLGSKPAHASV